jgi:hypothetical protein
MFFRRLRRVLLRCCAMDLATLLIQCLNARQYGLLLFLLASGLTPIFGIMGVCRLAAPAATQRPWPCSTPI